MAEVDPRTKDELTRVIYEYLRAENRWLVDCWVCGDPWTMHEDGACVRTEFSKPRGINPE